MEGFMLTNADEALKFYEACADSGADTAEKRIALLRQWVKEKKIGYLPHPEVMLDRPNVLDLRKKGKHSNGTN